MSELIPFPQPPITSSFFDQTQLTRGRFHAGNFPAVPPPKPSTPIEPQRKDFSGDDAYQRAMNAWLSEPAVVAWINATDAYVMQHYYDLGWSQYLLHARTRETVDLQNARKVCDSWWLGEYVKGGTVLAFDREGPAPRHAGILGLLTRAADGRPEFYDYCVAYTRYHFDNWLKSRIPKLDDPNPQLYLGVREGAFCLMYAAAIAKFLPDSYPNAVQVRAGFLADVELVTLKYFETLQKPDGSWRWNDPYSPDADGSTPVGIMQPFMVGLLLNALIAVYYVTDKAGIKASVISQVSKACRHLYLDGPYSTQLIPSLGLPLNGFHYVYHGGTQLNPTKYAKGDLPANWDTNNRSDIQNQRQAIATIVGPYGFLYAITGGAEWKRMGDELWEAAYGDRDGIRNYMAGDAKSYNQNCSFAPFYLPWTKSTQQPLPPEPEKPPMPTESPDGFKGIKIVDSEGRTWTFNAQGKTLRDGVPVGAGAGTMYKYLTKVVYVLGVDNPPNWYQWVSSRWSKVGREEPGVVQPPVVDTKRKLQDVILTIQSIINELP